MRMKIGLGSLAMVASAWALGFSSPAVASPTSQITQAIDETKLVTLTHNTRPEAKLAANDRGAVPASQKMIVELLLRRSDANETAFSKVVDDLSNPKSPSFHHWLTNDQIAAYGPSDLDIAKVNSWLTTHGFAVGGVSPDRTFFSFSGTAAQMGAAFHTSIHNLSVGGVAHYANMSDPQIPAALAPAVAGPVALHDFTGHMNAIKKTQAVRPKGTSSSGQLFYIMPEDLATIYNLKPLFQAGITGKGQTIVVIEDSDVFKQADWNVFRAVGGLSVYKDATFTEIHPTGTATCQPPGVQGAEGEAAIDVDWASAAAPDANIVLASCADKNQSVTGFGGLLALQNLVAQATPPKVMSMSYGECEVASGVTGNAAFNTVYKSAVAKGVTIFVSSGDEDASSCDAVETVLSRTTETIAYEAGIGVSGWASSPYDVAVGGTDFGTQYNLCQGANSFPACMSPYWNATNDKYYGSAKSYMPEIPWNDSCAGQLITTYAGYTTPYGTNGFCNSAAAKGTTVDNTLQNNVGGSGGPSGCATGTASSSTDAVSGTCAGYAKPAWQVVFGNPSDSKRDIPDVALFASNGFWSSYYIVCDSENDGSEGTPTGCTGANPQNWAGYGGTSVSSPIMAGIQALINQKTGQSWGVVNNQYYALAASEYGLSGSATCNSSLGNAIGSSCVFNDITQGDMTAVCGVSQKFSLSTDVISTFGSVTSANCYRPSGTAGVLSTSTSSYQPAYATGTGWDFATGIGSVNATNLVNAFAAGNFTPVLQ